MAIQPDDLTVPGMCRQINTYSKYIPQKKTILILIIPAHHFQNRIKSGAKIKLVSATI